MKKDDKVKLVVNGKKRTKEYYIDQKVICTIYHKRISMLKKIYIFLSWYDTYSSTP